ncbi:hypothetical protein V8C26DRAFT_378153 [Trichoderma gracile]
MFFWGRILCLFQPSLVGVFFCLLSLPHLLLACQSIQKQATISWSISVVPLQGFFAGSRLAVAKPGAKGAEKHIFLIDPSRGGPP